MEPEGHCQGCLCLTEQPEAEPGQKVANRMAHGISVTTLPTGMWDAQQLISNAPRVLPTSPPRRSRACAGHCLCIVMACRQRQHHRAAWRRTNRLTAPCRGLVTAQPHWGAKRLSQSRASDTFILSTSTHTETFTCYEEWRPVSEIKAIELNSQRCAFFRWQKMSWLKWFAPWRDSGDWESFHAGIYSKGAKWHDMTWEKVCLNSVYHFK